MTATAPAARPSRQEAGRGATRGGTRSPAVPWVGDEVWRGAGQRYSQGHLEEDSRPGWGTGGSPGGFGRGGVERQAPGAGWRAAPLKQLRGTAWSAAGGWRVELPSLTGPRGPRAEGPGRARRPPARRENQPAGGRGLSEGSEVRAAGAGVAGARAQRRRRAGTRARPCSVSPAPRSERPRRLPGRRPRVAQVEAGAGSEPPRGSGCSCPSWPRARG